MHPHQHHEIFEIEVLGLLNKGGLLRSLVFGGGTALRLCHELPRYSVGLDFWFSKKIDVPIFYRKLLEFLKKNYAISDTKNKHYTLLYEFKGKTSDRSLKLEIRKDVVKDAVEEKIAYSKYASAQVLVKAFPLESMLQRKQEAAKDRTEIRDFFDLEFLLRKGQRLLLRAEDKAILKKKIEAFKLTDYSVALGALLESDLRQYYIKEKFKFLLEN